MTPFFTALHAALRDKEQFKFTLTRDGDTLSAVILPLLGEAPEDLDENDAAAQVRGALATPLLIKTTPAEFDALAASRFAEYNSVRAPLDTAYQALIGSLEDAGKNAQVAVANKSSTVKAGKKSKSAIPKPTATQAEAEPDDDDESTPAPTAEGVPATASQGGLFAND